MIDRSISILIADDHPMVRKGLISFIKSVRAIDTIYEAENGNEVLRLAEQHSIDLFLLDVEMPHLNGYETSKFLLKKKPLSRIIIHTMYDGSALINGLLYLGVKGVVTKGEDPDLLVIAIEKILQGETFLSPKLKMYVSNSFHDANDLEFSITEKQLVKLLGQGLTSSEIATKLGFSIRTAETYRYRLLKRLSLSTSAELINYFHRNGIMN